MDSGTSFSDQQATEVDVDVEAQTGDEMDQEKKTQQEQEQEQEQTSSQDVTQDTDIEAQGQQEGVDAPPKTEAENDAFLVYWSEPEDQDPENPMYWSPTHKWIIIGTLSFLTFLR
jgi:hypothetical protein